MGEYTPATNQELPAEKEEEEQSRECLTASPNNGWEAAEPISGGLLR